MVPLISTIMTSTDFPFRLLILRGRFPPEKIEFLSQIIIDLGAGSSANKVLIYIYRYNSIHECKYIIYVSSALDEDQRFLHVNCHVRLWKYCMLDADFYFAIRYVLKDSFRIMSEACKLIHFPQ